MPRGCRESWWDKAVDVRALKVQPLGRQSASMGSVSADPGGGAQREVINNTPPSPLCTPHTLQTHSLPENRHPPSKKDLKTLILSPLSPRWISISFVVLTYKPPSVISPHPRKLSGHKPPGLINEIRSPQKDQRRKCTRLQVAPTCLPPSMIQTSPPFFL